ncbi:PREDICTED: uncharacterized protein LOC108758469 [Trachymyrmex cornetzi]|uniref:uncharacterized protein LOC108758469 n=1 Tax=Trachymyrmex cornetzi TaxID=471704 RepID=UPI00084F5DD8|nr:PREDICTED: uncharacterized protein LOC108758469 [Trachymyrmex cornetzi]
MPHMAQLYSVHIRYMNTGIGTLFILCDVRTTTMYDALWDKIIQMVPQLKENVKFIMSNFEMAAVKSLSTKFPRVKLTGCWFHFNQPDMFQEAMSIIQIEADILFCEYPDILQFTSYLRRTWSNMASRISTYDCPIRTNNIVESFHNIAAQKLGTKNINIWTFLEKLADLITDQELDFRRLRNNVRPRRNHTRTNRERDIKIINA